MTIEEIADRYGIVEPIVRGDKVIYYEWAYKDCRGTREYYKRIIDLKTNEWKSEVLKRKPRFFCQHI